MRTFLTLNKRLDDHNYPNPFNSETETGFSIPGKSNVSYYL